MNRSSNWLVGGLLLWFAGGLPCHGASPPLVLVDRSGSMKGFDATGTLAEVVRVVREATPAEPTVLWFASEKSRPTQLTSWQTPPPYGGETRLFEAVQEGLRRAADAPVVWLLTDNVPSSESPDADLERLYDWLRGTEGRPHAVTLFVLQLPFRGTLYGRDGHTPQTRAYSGPRAVLLYALLMDPGDRESFRQTLDRVQAGLTRSLAKAHLRLQCKPLAVDTIEAQIEPGTMHLDEAGVLVGDGHEGQPFEGSFVVRLRSKLKGVEFLKARPTFVTEGSFSTADFDTGEAKADLAQPVIEEIGGGWVTLRAKLTTGPVRLRRTFGSALKAFRKGDQPGILAGHLRLKLEVDRKSVVISSEDVSAFSTGNSVFTDASPETQSRVYRLQELFQAKFVEETLLINPAWTPAAAGQPERVPVRIRVAYSPLSAAILLLPLLFVLALIALVGAYVKLYSSRFQISSDGVELRTVRLAPTFDVRVQEGVAGRFWHLPPWLWFSAARGWTVEGSQTKSLGRQGGSFEIVNKRADVIHRLSLRPGRLASSETSHPNRGWPDTSH